MRIAVLACLALLLPAALPAPASATVLACERDLPVWVMVGCYSSDIGDQCLVYTQLPGQAICWLPSALLELAEVRVLA